MLIFATALCRAETVKPILVATGSWLLRFAMRAVAGSLNMPESFLANTCAFTVAYVEAAEQRAIPVCPFRVWREFKAQRRPAASPSRIRQT